MGKHTKKRSISLIVVLSIIFGIFTPMIGSTVEIPDNHKFIRLGYGDH